MPEGGLPHHAVPPGGGGCVVAANRYFGNPDDPWLEILNDGPTSRAQVPTPVGVPCHACSVPVAEDDQGTFFLVCGPEGDTEWPVHRECALRMVLGPIEHLERRCPCYGGVFEGEALSERDSAIAVWAWVERNGLPA